MKTETWALSQTMRFAGDVALLGVEDASVERWGSTGTARPLIGEPVENLNGFTVRDYEVEGHVLRFGVLWE